MVESLEKTLQEREAPNDLLAYEKMLTTLVIREIQNKTTVRHPHINHQK